MFDSQELQPLAAEVFSGASPISGVIANKTALQEANAEQKTEKGGISPWRWVPSLYFAEGIPYVLVMTVSVIMYKKFGVANDKIALFTSLLYLPWVVKPLWGPLVDLYWTKRNWIVWLQLLLGLLFIGMGFMLNSPIWWWGSLAVFVVAAFTSATHDIAADGFYMLGLSEHKQAMFVGIRSTFYRTALIVGNGFLVILVGVVESRTGPTPVPLTLQSAPQAAFSSEAPAGEKSFLFVTPSVVTLAPGTTTSLAVSLNEAPAKDVVVTVSRKPSKWYRYFLPIGDEQLLKVTGGDRLVFDSKNWNQPQNVVAEADKNVAQVKNPVSAVFEVRAGNIPFSWMVCFFAMGGLFILLFLYHSTLGLPRPPTDGAGDTSTRPAFMRAAAWLLLTVLAPILLIVGMFYGLHDFSLWLLSFPVRNIAELGATSKLAVSFAASAVMYALVLWAVNSVAQSYRRNSGAPSGSGFSLSAALAVAFLFAVLFVGIKPSLLWSAQHIFKPELLANPKLKDVPTFFTHVLIIFVVWLIYRASTVRRVSLDAFRGSSALSGIPFDNVFISFFKKPGIGRMIAFLLLYRLGESMIVKMASPFLIDARSAGGIGLTTAQLGVAYGTIGVFALLLGGIMGGLAVATGGLKKWILWMCLAINLPNGLYVYLAHTQPESFPVVLLCVAGEQFFYGIGFAAYMLYMLYIAGEGEHKTSHFAITTGFMALGMMLPGMFAGALQMAMGYTWFFAFATSTTVIGVVMIFMIPIDPEFGKKKKTAKA